LLATTLLSVGLIAAAAVACDHASDEANKAGNAQATANDKSGAAVRESNENIETAQAEGDQKIAAHADFMKMRENFRHETTRNLVDLDRKVDILTVEADHSTGQEKTDRDAGLMQIHASRDAFQKLSQSLDSASESTWDDAKSRVDKEWTDLEALVDKA
jgi:hypothetical protein